MSRSSRMAAKLGVALVLFLAVASYAQTPSAPVLSSPTNGAIGVAVTTTVSWGSVTGATAYHLQVTTLSSFDGTPAINQDGITATSFTAVPLTAGTTYYWRVEAEGPTGTSVWSTIWNITMANGVPAAPLLSSPTNGAIPNYYLITLSWSSVLGAKSYGLQISWDSTFASTILRAPLNIHNFRIVLDY